eukprot:3564340-Amphidinium_carterae.1
MWEKSRKTANQRGQIVSGLIDWTGDDAWKRETQWAQPLVAVAAVATARAAACPRRRALSMRCLQAED